MKSDVSERITGYLGNGGLWNPDLMNHDEVRDLVVDCREEIDRLRDNMQRMVSGFRSHLGDLIRRIGPARLPMDIKAKLEDIHDSYNAWGDKSAEEERDRFRKSLLHILRITDDGNISAPEALQYIEFAARKSLEVESTP